MRRRRAKGGDPGSQGGGTHRMQRKICRTAQARRRLHLFRLHAEPDLRYRGSQSDAGRAEAHRRTIYRVPRSRAAKQYRGGVRGKTAAATAAATIAAGHLPKPARKSCRAATGASAQQAIGRGRRCEAPESVNLRRPFLFLRLAAALLTAQRPEESARSE